MGERGARTTVAGPREAFDVGIHHRERKPLTERPPHMEREGRNTRKGGREGCHAGKGGRGAAALWRGGAPCKGREELIERGYFLGNPNSSYLYKPNKK